MKVANLFIYPIKSCGGISLEQAKVTAKGLTDCNSPQIYDRQFMLVDNKGKFLTQREYPQLATIKLQIKDNKLYLSSHNSELPPWELIPDDSKTETKVKVWQSNTVAIDQGDEIANWFKQALNLDIDFRLVKQSDN